MPERRLTARRAPRDAVGVYVFPKGERGQLRGGGREREETSATPITGVTPVLRRRALVPEDASEARAVYDEDEPTVTAAGSEPEEATELAADPRKPFRPRRTRTPAERKRLEIHELLAARDPVSALQGLSPRELKEIALVGHRLFDLGKLNAARVIFEGLVGLGSDEAFPHTMLGTVYLALGDRGHAMLLFEAALRLDRYDLAARVYRGEILLTAGKHKEATRDLREAIDQGPEDDPFVERAKRLLEMAEERRRRRK